MLLFTISWEWNRLRITSTDEWIQDIMGTYEMKFLLSEKVKQNYVICRKIHSTENHQVTQNHPV